MRKFTIYTRATPTCRRAGITIVEVECEKIQGLEDPSVMRLPESEYFARITAPDWLYESREVTGEDGVKVKTPVPPVYHSHALYWTLIQARVYAEKMVREEFEFLQRKKGSTFTEEEVKVKLAEIQEIMLP
jgi:hypothetical protein